uniref:Uncharacterized protein n=1 Tax=Glossina austeni TaxID=7395 RepID=A0A1A9VMR8_GLOAU
MICVSTGVSSKEITEGDVCYKKAMWCVLWDGSGNIRPWEIFLNAICYRPNGDDERQWWQTTDKNDKRQFNISIHVYLPQLDRVYAVIMTKRSHKKNRIVFHHYNACPHFERHIIERIANEGWELLPPTDYHVNHSLSGGCQRKHECFDPGIDGLLSKWEAVIEVDGDYAPD